MQNKLVTTQLDRERAIGAKIGDPIIDTFQDRAEQLFIPKRYKYGDWLMEHTERGQGINQYTASQVTKWSNPETLNTIVLYMLDDEVPADMIAALQLYCEAFFEGMKIKILQPGDEFTPGKRLPKDFYASNKIKHRDDDTESEDRQAYTMDILSKLLKYKDSNTYCILGVTMTDLYPGINWNYCFGWANFNRGSGVFSFKRYEPDYDGNTHSYEDYIRLACHTMAHEICHMFNLVHCIHYECLMNGYNSLQEQIQRKNNTLCPVCIKKLKANIKFDTEKRFQKL